VFASHSHARALAAGLPRQDYFWLTIEQLLRCHKNEFDEILCKLDSTQFARFFEPNPRLPERDHLEPTSEGVKVIIHNPHHILERTGTRTESDISMSNLISDVWEISDFGKREEKKGKMICTIIWHIRIWYRMDTKSDISKFVRFPIGRPRRPISENRAKKGVSSVGPEGCKSELLDNFTKERWLWTNTTIVLFARPPSHGAGCAWEHTWGRGRVQDYTYFGKPTGDYMLSCNRPDIVTARGVTVGLPHIWTVGLCDWPLTWWSWKPPCHGGS